MVAEKQTVVERARMARISGGEPTELDVAFVSHHDANKSEDEIALELEMWDAADVISVVVLVAVAAASIGVLLWGVVV